MQIHSSVSLILVSDYYCYFTEHYRKHLGLMMPYRTTAAEEMLQALTATVHLDVICSILLEIEDDVFD